MDLSHIKPFQTILLIVFGFLAILGLVLFSKFGGFGNTSANVGTVTIWGVLPGDQMTTVLASLKAGSQDYGNVSYVQKSEQTFDSDLAEAIASGAGPDLILISQEDLAEEQNKLSVIPFSVISQRDYLDTYLPIDELFLAQNGTYGIPFAVDPLVLYYNRSILTQGGIATPPGTWEGITGLSEQLSQVNAGVVSRSVIPFGSYDNVSNARAIVSLLLLQAGNTITSVTQSGVQGTLTSGDTATTPAVSAVTFYTQFSDPVKTVYTWNSSLPEARQSFLAGNLVFYPGFASELPFIQSANPNLDFDMVAIPQPQTAAQKKTYGKAYAFAVPKASANAAGAVSVSLAIADATRAASNAQAVSMVPAVRAALGTNASDRFQPVYYPQALLATGWLSPSPSATDTIFSTMIKNITSGRLGIGQALYTANQALTAAL